MADVVPPERGRYTERIYRKVAARTRALRGMDTTYAEGRLRPMPSLFGAEQRPVSAADRRAVRSPIRRPPGGDLQVV